MSTVSIPTSCNSIDELQAIINDTGPVKTSYKFPDNLKIEVEQPLTIYSDTDFLGNASEKKRPVFSLSSKITDKLFPLSGKFGMSTPVIGQKESVIKNVYISGIEFFGNDTKLPGIPGYAGTDPVSTAQTGKGYTNFIGLSNASGISIYNLTARKTLGDIARLKNATSVVFANTNVVECGHDIVFIDTGSNVVIKNNYGEIRTNCAVRLRNVKNGQVKNNNYVNKLKGTSTGPILQIQVETAANNITIENNYLKGSWGPGIWIVGLKNTETDAGQKLTVQNNVFENCGLTSKISTVAGSGGICCDGWDSVNVLKNIFVNCKCSGITYGPWVNSSSKGKGYSSTVKNNIFCNITQGNISGSENGSAICSPTGKYSVSIVDNAYYGNFNDLYNGLTATGSKTANPVLMTDADGKYYVSKDSPYYSWGAGIVGTTTEEPAEEEDPEVVTPVSTPVYVVLTGAGVSGLVDELKTVTSENFKDSEFKVYQEV